MRTALHTSGSEGKGDEEELEGWGCIFSYLTVRFYHFCDISNLG